MKKVRKVSWVLFAAFLAAALVMGSCATAPPSEPAESTAAGAAGSKTAEPEAAAKPSAESVETELEAAWGNAEVRIATGNAHDLEGDRTVAGFRCVWTDGQFAGDVYPQQFVSRESGEEVPMEFTWDNGGRIAEGVYDVYVEIDGRAGDGWLRELPLVGAKQIEVIIDLNACQFALPFDTYRKVTVYPAGTYSDFNSRNMLDAIPEDQAISWYDEENRGQWAVAPSGTFDLRVEYTDGTTEWLQDYELPANARVTEL